jgi:hypothetical protein
MKTVTALSIAALVLISGCEARLEPWEGEVVVPAVKTNTDRGFCPPGQAKKGRC